MLTWGFTAHPSILHPISILHPPIYPPNIHPSIPSDIPFCNRPHFVVCCSIWLMHLVHLVSGAASGASGQNFFSDHDTKFLFALFLALLSHKNFPLYLAHGHTALIMVFAAYTQQTSLDDITYVDQHPV